MLEFIRKSRILALEALHFVDTARGVVFLKNAATAILEASADLQATGIDEANLVKAEEDLKALAGFRAALKSGEKIQAIKALRMLTGLGLRETKTAVEALSGVKFDRRPEPAPTPMRRPFEPEPWDEPEISEPDPCNCSMCSPD